MQARDEEVQVDFIVVKSFSPYTAILARPWLHVKGAVSSTLHLKVKYPIQGRDGELVGSQAMAKQCLIATFDRVVMEEERIPKQSKGPEIGLRTESQGVLSRNWKRF